MTEQDNQKGTLCIQILTRYCTVNRTFYIRNIISSVLGCRHEGKLYKHGKTFKDDCNTCRCRNGVAACTRKACPPKFKRGKKDTV